MNHKDYRSVKSFNNVYFVYSGNSEDSKNLWNHGVSIGNYTTFPDVTIEIPSDLINKPFEVELILQQFTTDMDEMFLLVERSNSRVKDGKSFTLTSTAYQLSTIRFFLRNKPEVSDRWLHIKCFESSHQYDELYVVGAIFREVVYRY